MSAEQSNAAMPTNENAQQEVSLPQRQPKQEPFWPRIIGIYGVSGAGKTTLLNELRQKLDDNQYLTVDGSDLLFHREEKTEEAMKKFKQLSKPEQEMRRQQAIASLQLECQRFKKHAIVAGHFMFWEDSQKAKDANVVWTDEDAKVYTHIIYLQVNPMELVKRRVADNKRDRTKLPPQHLELWQKTEMAELRGVCYANKIPFIVIEDGGKVRPLVEEFVRCDAGAYEDSALEVFQERFNHLHPGEVDRVLVIDADKTLSASDAGALFCETVKGCEDALHKIFSSALKYSSAAFYQAVLLFEEAVRGEKWDAVCSEIAEKIIIHDEFVDILQMAAKKQDLGVVVVTCGIGDVWKKVLEKHGLGDSATVIGGGRLNDQMIVTPDVKRRVVKKLQTEGNAFVWAFGDSQLDLPMLEQADQAVVVVCNKEARSKSMDEKLTESIVEKGLFARQMLLPSNVRPRLSGNLLPVVHPADIAFEIPLIGTLQLLHATNQPACKMLAAPTRDTRVQGPALQQAHCRVGCYRATELLPKAVGLEKYKMTSAQMDPTKAPSSGHRIRDEGKTVIISCMRGGDPLAQGVFEALPSAGYVHANKPTDLDNDKHQKAVGAAKTILICDFVVNEGGTMVDLVKHIRKHLNKTARIVLMAGVVQADTVKDDGGLVSGLKGYGNVSLVTLRFSKNKFKASGAADTGSRLFNTTTAETVVAKSEGDGTSAEEGEPVVEKGQDGKNGALE